MKVKERIAALRAAMKANNIDAYIIPTEDPHLSEYPAACWKYREWISGFTGSAGTVVVTADKAGLWTDSRYFLQAENQLAGTCIDLYRLKIEGTPSISEFLCKELKDGMSVGINDETFSIASADNLRNALARNGISLASLPTLIDEIWVDRPAIPDSAVWQMPVSVAGRSTTEKIRDINRMVKEAGGDFTVVSALDEIAWIFNIRGNDVAYNPVAVAYACISPSESVLFIDKEKLPTEVAMRLQNENVKIEPYKTLGNYLHNLPARSKVVVDEGATNAAILGNLPEGSTVINRLSAANYLKSIKNEVLPQSRLIRRDCNDPLLYLA